MRVWPYIIAAAAVLASPTVAAPASNSAHAYVSQLAVSAPDGRIARFEKPVCPAAYGLSEQLSAQLTARMRSVAAAAGATVQPAGCKANVLLFVPKDRKQLFTQLRSERPEVFGRMPDSEIRDLQNSSEPAVAWHVMRQRGADGRVLSGAWREGQPLIQESVTNSRLLPSARSELDVAVVVLDAQAALGLTVTELADYAVMRGLAQTRGDASTAALPTIVAAFHKKQQGQPVPLSLTAMDLAYLKALYRTASFDNVRTADVVRLMGAGRP